MTAAGSTPATLYSTYSYGYTDSWGDLLTSYRGVSFTYDEIGNPLTYYNGSSYTFTWENGRRLKTATVGSNTLSFTYNHDGIRTSKTVNGVVHNYTVSGSLILTEEWGTNLVVYLYDANGAPIGMQYRTHSMSEGVFYTFWFDKNLRGDVVAVYNEIGTKVLSYTYDAWGNKTTTVHNSSGSNSYAQYNAITYRGYYYDAETGFYYLQSRYYDPTTGRFLNADVFVSTGQGLLGNNMFAYCINNPCNYSDPSGMCARCMAQKYSNQVVASTFETCGGGGAAGGGGLLIPFTFKLTKETADLIVAAVAVLGAVTMKGTHHVYVLRDTKADNIVKYVGRTNDPDRREYEHQHDPNHPEREHYKMQVIASGLTLDEARLVEQIVISAYTLKYLDNARNEIARGKRGQSMQYIGAVMEIFAGTTEQGIWALLGG